MKVSDIAHRIESILDSHPRSASFKVFVSSDTDKDTGDVVETFSWNEKGHFFLVPQGRSSYLEVCAEYLTAQQLLQILIELKKEIWDYTAYARVSINTTEDGEITSRSSRLHSVESDNKRELLYFCHGKLQTNDT